jgi:exodeoxyribonuclease VII small subunit
MPEEDKQSFENSLNQLEDRVRRLDTGELSLDEALSVFESGVKLVRECQELLDGAEQRITELGADTIEPKTTSDVGSAQ